MKKLLVCAGCMKDGCSTPNGWCSECRYINLEPILPMSNEEIEILYMIGMCDYRIHNGCRENCDGFTCETAIRLITRIQQEETDKLKLLEMLEEFTSCEPSWSDDRIDYEEIQIDKKTKLKAQELIKSIKDN